MTEPTPAQAEMIAACYNHAVSNYNKDGWDFIVECWSTHDFMEVLATLPADATLEALIEDVHTTAKLLDGQRREVRATEW